MRWRQRTSTRKYLSLALAIFIVSAGVGVLIGVLTSDKKPDRVVVRHVVVSRPTAASTSTDPTTATTVARRTRPASPSYAGTVPSGAQSSFDSLESGLPGGVGLAVAPLGQGGIHAFGRAQTAAAWSTSKVPVLVTLLHNYEQSGKVLSPAGRTDATLAIEQSDNAAIDALFSQLEQIYGGLVPGSKAMTRMLRKAGDDATTINTAPNNRGFTTEGQTQWSVSGEVSFYRALARGCLLNGQDTSYVLSLMRSVIPSERWGAGSAGYPTRVSLGFKGGWGPDVSGSYQVRQTAIVGSGAHGYVISVLALPSSGLFGDGTSMVTGLVTWAREHLNLNARRPPAGCAG